MWGTAKTIEDIKTRIQKDDSNINSKINTGRKEPDVENMAMGEARNFSLGILHIDIIDFTKKLTSLDNRSKLRFLNIFQSEMTHIIHDHSGSVEKYVGDRVTGLFGFNYSGQEVFTNSINTALAMKTEIKYLINPYLETIGLPTFQCRIGLDYGDILFAKTGIHGDNQSTLIGNSVSIASKLEELSKTNQILLGGSIYESLPEYEKKHCHQISSPKSWNWQWKNPKITYPIYSYEAHWKSHPL